MCQVPDVGRRTSNRNKEPKDVSRHKFEDVKRNGFWCCCRIANNKLVRLEPFISRYPSVDVFGAAQTKP